MPKSQVGDKVQVFSGVLLRVRTQASRAGPGVTDLSAASMRLCRPKWYHHQATVLPAAEEMELSQQGEEGTQILGGLYRD